MTLLNRRILKTRKNFVEHKKDLQNVENIRRTLAVSTESVLAQYAADARRKLQVNFQKVNEPRNCNVMYKFSFQAKGSEINNTICTASLENDIASAFERLYNVTVGKICVDKNLPNCESIMEKVDLLIAVSRFN